MKKARGLAGDEAASACLPALPFRSINRRGTAGYDAGLQRHHLLPKQLLKKQYFGKMFTAIGTDNVGFDDFRTNGILLPCREDTAIRLCLPLHRGPHPDYNEMVIERVSQIEREWSSNQLSDPELAIKESIFRLSLLQSALRKRLMVQHRRLILNQKDPVGTGFDFDELDAMAGALWNSTS